MFSNKVALNIKNIFLVFIYQDNMKISDIDLHTLRDIFMIFKHIDF